MQGRLFTLLDQGFPSYFVTLLRGRVHVLRDGRPALHRRRSASGSDPDTSSSISGLAEMLIAGVAGARILHVFVDGFFWDYVHLCTESVARREPAAHAASEVRRTPTTTASGTPLRGSAWRAKRTASRGRSSGTAGSRITAGSSARPRRPGTCSVTTASRSGRARIGGHHHSDRARRFGRQWVGLLAGCCFWQRPRTALGLVFSRPTARRANGSTSTGSRRRSSCRRSPSTRRRSTKSRPRRFAIAAFWPVLRPAGGSGLRRPGVPRVHRALYAVARFVIEFVRSDDRGGLGRSEQRRSSSESPRQGCIITVFVAHARGGSRRFARGILPAWGCPGALASPFVDSTRDP